MKLLLIILSSIIIPNVGICIDKEGKSGGNGGGAWICYNKDYYKTIRWTKLVDLFEAKKQHKLTLRKFAHCKDHRSIIDEMKIKLSLIDKDFYEELIPYFHEVDENYQEVDIQLNIITDVDEDGKPQPHECLNGVIKYAQIANYKDEGPLLINEYLFNHNKFDQVNRAALIFHETIYAYLRDKLFDTTSKRTREIVGYIFSTAEDSVIKKHIHKLINRRPIELVDMKFVKINQGMEWQGSCTQGSYRISSKTGCKSFYPKRSEAERKRFVKLDYDFEMQITEVTQRLYFEIMDNNPSKHKELIDCPETFEVRKNKNNEDVNLCPNHPVERVSWHDITYMFLPKINAITRRNYRLPTDVEWEFATRAGTKTDYFFGDSGVLWENYSSTEYNTVPVGTYRIFSNNTNGNGLYDLYGNVAEWTADSWTEYPEGGLNPRTNFDSYIKTVRGCSYTSYTLLRRCRSSYKNFAKDITKSSSIGFRLVRTLP